MISTQAGGLHALTQPSLNHLMPGMPQDCVPNSYKPGPSSRPISKKVVDGLSESEQLCSIPACLLPCPWSDPLIRNLITAEEHHRQGTYMGANQFLQCLFFMQPPCALTVVHKFCFPSSPTPDSLTRAALHRGGQLWSDQSYSGRGHLVGGGSG